MTVRLVVRRAGPLRVEGDDVELVDSKGRPIDPEGRTALLICRCGASRSRPFCDGSHCRIGFESIEQDESSQSSEA